MCVKGEEREADSENVETKEGRPSKRGGGKKKLSALLFPSSLRIKGGRKGCLLPVLVEGRRVGGRGVKADSLPYSLLASTHNCFLPCDLFLLPLLFSTRDLASLPF